MIRVKSLFRRPYLAARACALRPFYAAASPKPGRGEIRSILVLRLDRIGDMVLTTPLLSALRQAYPKARIAVWASPANAGVLFGNADVDEVRAASPVGAGAREAWAGESFDLIVDTANDYPLQWASLARGIEARWRLGYDIAGRGLWYNLRVAPPPPGPSFAEVMLDLCRRGLGIALASAAPKVCVSEDERARARELLRGGGVEEGRALVLLHPGGFYAAQRWPAERFGEVCRRLEDSGLCRAALVGGPSDGPALEAARARVGSLCVFTIGDLRSLIGLLSHARVLVCNNSGPLHLGCALGLRTVSTLGPATDRRLWAPRGDRHLICEEADLDRLSVERVAAAAKEALRLG
ncbi:MAG: glycosyltransferase family 9 protein [Elusimicrobia bacterium]|nr:glycosyltransferase family 9 protein [Elusimicrobiota bacterium]